MPPIVLLHGYGCALGIFFPCINSLYETINVKLNKYDKNHRGKEPFRLKNVRPTVHLYDWLGHGLSARPKFNASYTREDTERLFVETLEDWRKTMGYEQMILCGHSMG